MRLLCSVLLICVASTVGAQSKLLRFPDIHSDKVAFVYAGDIWVSPSSGGLARRVTAHAGLELFPKFSPDGKWIAFTGQYDGDEQVYVIPADGGVPKQLTYYPARGPLAPRWGYDNQVYGWSPDGKQILFRSSRDGWSVADNLLYTVPAEGGPATALPMPRSGAGAFSPDGKKVAYSPLFRDFRSEKRYSGGWANDLYLFDLTTHASENFTNHARTDRDPMWVGNKVFFSSDRDGTFNLYSYDVTAKRTTQLTRSKQWDVRWPSADKQGRIVYEMDGELHVFDSGANADRKLSIQVPDDGVHSRPARVSAANQIEGFSLSPKGERAVFVARGDVFTVPIEKGDVRNITASSGAHDKWARWSHDGRKIAFLSDRSGDDEVYVIDQDGSGKPEQLTTGGQAMRYAAEWSGDGKRLAFSDKDGRLYVLTTDDKKLTEIVKEKRGQVRDYTWSNDGGHLAFTLSEPTGFRALHIWSVADSQTRKITDGLFTVGNPTWDPEGNYLYFLSAREFAPQLSGIEFNFAANRSTGIFAMALRKDVKHPFPPESDEVAVEEPKKEEPKKAEAAKKEHIKIDFDGLATRVVRVPVDADNYGGLVAIKGHLLYAKFGAGFYGRQSEHQPILRSYSLKERKETVVAERLTGGYAVSHDGSKVLVRHANEFRLYDLPAKAPSATGKLVATRGLMVDRVPKEEWAEIFDEVWRRFRDFFYVPNMHGYDWKALREQYRPLLQHVGHRADLNYVIAEMISELAVSHAYIDGGDFQLPPRPQVGLPGARFALDPASQRYKIARIFRGQNEEDRYRSPLTEVGVDVKEGDFILAVDGEELKLNEDPYKLLRHKADRTITLTVNSRPSMDGSRKISYRPISNETNLVYLSMVTANREKVEKLTNGRVGYIHVPDMGADGIREFIKYWYPQIRKEGMVVDMRGNGGGNVSQMLIQRMRQVVSGIGWARTSETPSTYPGTTFHGAMVCLLNETSASDGDIFPNQFRRNGLGPLIGKRSWGGVVGITDRGPLLDGGIVNVPEFGNAAADGKWEVEGIGVEPDIVVENEPAEVLKGRDPQLERGVEEVLKRMQANPKKLPARPPDPVKTK